MITKRKSRSLYQCYNAKCRGVRIVCGKGQTLGPKGNGNGTISLLKLKRGTPLEYSVCQDCGDFKSMGGPVAAKDRGWD